MHADNGRIVRALNEFEAKYINANHKDVDFLVLVRHEISDLRRYFGFQAHATKGEHIDMTLHDQQVVMATCRADERAKMAP